MKRHLCLLPAALFCIVLRAASLPEGFSETILASGLSNPVSMAFAPDGRIFICEQSGRLKVWKNGAILPTPFVNLSVDSNGDRGLLAVALDPDFTQNGYVYLLYTRPTSPAQNVIARFTANGDVAQSGSEIRIFNLPLLSASVHHCDNSMGFGPDGKLYIGVADNSNGANSQSMDTLLGKMLRINSDGSIPADNPFYDSLEGDLRAIWALGVRNPFTFAFEPNSGRMLINDVGFSTWEEINDGAAGGNYGWPESEGATTTEGMRSPLFSYRHGTTNETGCAITGGAFYAPAAPQFPAEYSGRYFFIDYCSAWLRMLDFTEGVRALPFGTGLAQYPVTLKVGPDGSLYYLSRGSNAFKGSLRRIHYSPAVIPVIAQQPGSQTVFTGDAATFSVSATGAFPMTYQWRRNGQPIAGATADSYTLNAAQLSDSGAVFTCAASNAYGTANSANATLTVMENQAPVVTIQTPAAATVYRAGTTATFSATATDPEDGALPESAFTWQIEQVRPSHARPLTQPILGRSSGSIELPNIGQPDADVSYRFICTVRDSRGAETSVSRELFPQLVNVRLQTDVTGLALELDAQPSTGAIDFTGVSGFRRRVGTSTPQRKHGNVYDFLNWSDGGAIVHEIATPDSDAGFVAHFRQRSAPLPGRIVLNNTGELESGDELKFSASLSFDPFSKSYGWHWDFGDGSTSTAAQSVTHVFEHAGAYTVMLTITDDMGLQSTQFFTVSIISADLDNDGIPNRADPDNDNDGFSDATEIAAGTNPRDPASIPVRPARPVRLLKFAGVALQDVGKPDTLSFQLMLPADVDLGQRFTLSVGGEPITFSRTKPGHWSAPSAKLTLTHSRKSIDPLITIRARSPRVFGTLPLKSQKHALLIRISCATDTYECSPEVICVAQRGAVRLQYRAPK